MTTENKDWISPAELARQLSVSRRTIFRHIASGRLPKPIYLGCKSPRWRQIVIDAALQKMSG